MSLAVTCVLLTADRPQFTPRAIRSFLSQTYPHKRLLIYDNGDVAYTEAPFDAVAEPPEMVRYVRGEYNPRPAFGQLRNLANGLVDTELIAHFDSDEWSHAERLETQVRLLEESGADLVGYKDLLFWDSTSFGDLPPIGDGSRPKVCEPGVLWLYRGGHTFAADTSRLYRRSLWEKHPYPAKGLGADTDWLYGIPVNRRAVVSSFEGLGHPMMIAHIHGGNMQREHKWMNTNQGKRITDPELIEWVRERML